MLVSKLKMDFADAPWSMVHGARARAQQLFEAVSKREEPPASGAETSERLSLSELLYRALVEPVEALS